MKNKAINPAPSCGVLNPAGRISLAIHPRSRAVGHSGRYGIKILIAASEVTPIAKVGGLGDVVGALPRALIDLGLDVRIIIPFYGLINRSHGRFKLLKKHIKVESAGRNETVNLYITTLPDAKVPVYLIEHNFFAGKNIYGGQPANANKLYPNSLSEIEKFVFFSRALLACVKAMDWQPGIIHLNDWPTAAVALYLKAQYKDDPFFNKIKTLYTIHNIANQGIANVQLISLKPISPGPKSKNINLMAQGILNADLINTVSPAYAQEILTEEYGAGLEKILALRKKQLHGILNGLDVDFFNPRTDKLISHNYSLASLAKKSANKLALQKKLGLPVNKTVALAGLIGRLVWQKGLELFTEKFVGAIHELPLPCQFVFLGTGEKRYEDALLALAKKYPNKFSAQIKFDEKLAHQIYAGSDIFLVPSRFEPCGLTQMTAMRYGSVPLVRATGGLKDTVAPLTKGGKGDLMPRGIKPTGFTFKKFNSQEFYQTLKRALDIYYHQPQVWRQLQINGMQQDFSWDKSAKEYLKLYQKLLK